MNAMQPEPIFDLAHLGHLELLTPKPDESLKFFVDVMGMTVSGRKGESGYLRGWDDYERYSLKLTASKTSRRRAQGIRIRDRLDRWRSRPWSGVSLPRSGRPYRRALLRDRMVRGAAGAQAGAEKPGAALSGARRQCPPARSSQLPCGRHQGQPDFLRKISGMPADRTDRAQ